MVRLLLSLPLTVFLFACAEDSTTDQVASSAGNAVVEKLKGHLIAVEGEQIVEAELQGDPQYYVLYHSASW